MTKSTVKNTTINQKKSDEKRGVKAKTYKLEISTIERIDELSVELKKAKKDLIAEMVAVYEKQLGLS